MKLGRATIEKKVFLAPMAEVSDAPFRKICKEYGAGLTFTQMINAEGVFKNSFATLRYLAFSKSEKPIGVQLLGNNSEKLSEAISDLKQYSPDLIDLNCGCSAPKVCNAKMGASLLDHPELLSSLIKSMKNAAGEVPVSAKIRLGRNVNKNNALSNARLIEDGGASLLMIHARYRCDSYSTPPDWSWIKTVKKELSIPVAGNGSVFEPEDCIRMLEETQCDAILIARGALGNPFIFKRINSILENGTDPGEPSIEEVSSVAARHLQMLCDEYGEPLGVKTARKHMIWYFRNYSGIKSFIKDIYALNSAVLLEEFIQERAERIKNNYYPAEDLSVVKKSFIERVLFWKEEQ